MTQTLIGLAQAAAFPVAAAVITAMIMGIRWINQGPQFRVESPAMPALVEMHWTRKQAVEAATEITDEVGVQFSVIETV